MRGNLILPGQFRVTFDEQPDPTPRRDPRIFVGFAHLYCFERFMDFPQICHDFNVLPDTRAQVPPGVPNLMCCGTNGCATVIGKFVAICKGLSDMRLADMSYPRHSRGRQWAHRNTLNSMLGSMMRRQLNPWVYDRLCPHLRNLEPIRGIFNVSNADLHRSAFGAGHRRRKGEDDDDDDEDNDPDQPARRRPRR